MVAGGGSHSLFLKTDGTLWASGLNTNGQLGDNTTTQRLTPVQVRQTPASPVTYLTGVSAIAAGLNFSVALKSDGTVWAWGQNTDGQLGDNTTVTKNTLAVQVLAENGGSPAPLTGITAIAAGDSHALAVKSDGTVWAWGNGGNGRLGNGLTSDENTAVQTSFAPGTVITSVAAGSSHSLARKSDGTLWAWGYNANGRLGDGTITQRLTPVQVNVLTSVTTMSAGKAHSVAVESDGTVHTWGFNNYGQIGNWGATSQELSPILVSGITNTISVVAAADHTLAVTSDGIVWAWGRNDNGQLGDGTTDDRLAPVSISDPGFVWKVATPKYTPAGNNYFANQTVTISCATPSVTIRYTTDGTEPNINSQIGTSVSITATTTLKARAWKTNWPDSNVGTAVYTLQVTQPTFSPNGGTFTAPVNVTMSTTTPGAIVRYTTDGSSPTGSSPPYPGAPGVNVATTTTLKAAGFKSGWNDSTVRTATYNMDFGTLAPPTFDPGAGTHNGSVTVAMSAMPGATIRYTTNGSNPNGSSPVYQPPGVTLLPGTTTLKAAAFHPDYNTSTTTTGVYSVKVATPTFSLAPGTYPVGTGVTITSPTAGATIYYTLTGNDPTTSDPTIASGGSLIVGNFTLKAMATKSGCPQSDVAVATYATTGQLTPGSMSAGQYHSSAVRWDGLAYGWGSNLGGQLGVGTTTSSTTPVLVQTLTGVTAVAAGGWHTLFLRNDRTVWASGANLEGQLGDNTQTQRNSPVQVKTSPTAFLTDVTAIAAGERFSLALRTDGTVWAWGDNDYGQLGDNTNLLKKVAVQVLTDVSGVPTPLSGITAIAAGHYHALAIKSDGTVWAWGNGNNGRLGNGLIAHQDMAVQAAFAPGTVVTSVAAGNWHSLAVKADRTAWAWGWNGYGQLGTGPTPSESLVPIQVPGLSGIVAVSAGDSHSLALKDDDTAWSWGYGDKGRLGDGTGATHTSPVQVALPYVARLDAGYQHSLAMTTDGSGWAWGWNLHGQVGDGTTIDRWTPVQISGPYSWKVGTPTFTVPPGTYTTSQSVQVVCATPDVTIHYTTDGTEPTLASPVYTGPLAVLVTTTLKAQAFKDGLTDSNVATGIYTLKVATPTFNPAAGMYATAQSVTIQSTSPGATIRYTTDGTEPTAMSPVHSGALSIETATTLKAKGFINGWSDSDTGTAVYTFTYETLQAPTMTPPPGQYVEPLTVELADSLPTATIRYTTNGQTPTETSPIYTTPISIAVNYMTLMAKAWDGSVSSPTTTGNYAVKSAAPVFDLPSGYYGTPQSVTITAGPGATIYYTTNGAEPTPWDLSIPPGGSVLIDKLTTLKAMARKLPLSDSSTTRATYDIPAGLAATPTMTPGGGTYPTAQWVTLETATADATIRYTLDGTEPTLLSTVYLGPLSVDATLVLEAKAFKTGWTPSSMATASYNINLASVATPLFSLESGSYSTGRSITIVCATAGASIHYTTNGMDPTTSDPFVTSGQAVLVDQSLRLKAKAFKTGLADSAVRVADYWITGAIDAGETHSLALKSNGFVWAWGRNASGQLGDGTTNQRNSPIQVPGLAGIVALSAGANHSLAVSSDGTVWAWGANASGQLGNGGTSDSWVPVQLAGFSGVIEVAAGATHSLALKADGTVWAWGANDKGQLGDGTNLQRLTPVQVTLIGGVTRIAAGVEFSLALKTDGGTSGTVLGWGDNALNQLATGTTPANVPTIVLTDATLIAVGDGHGLAVKADGTAWAWGKNWLGQVGLGDNYPQTSGLNQVIGVEGGTALGAGSSHSLLVRPESGLQGSVWGWGSDYARLGTGVSNNVFAPFPVRALVSDAFAITGGVDHSLALRYDGSVWAWGFNGSGQLGTGLSGWQPVPRQVLGLLLDGGAMAADPDGDGLNTRDELQLGTDPYNADTNGDGIGDGVAADSGISPTDPDMDGDGVLNAVELAQGTDPFNNDTDGDGVADGADAFPLDPTRWQAPPPNPLDTTPPTITLTEPTSATLVSSNP